MLVNREQLHYLTMAEGAIHDKRAKASANAVVGIFVGCTWYHDEGNREKNVGARDRMEVTIHDGEGSYVVQTTLGIKGEAVTGGWMLASYLLGVTPGEEIQLSCHGGGDNAQVTAGFIEVKRGEAWVMAERAQYPGDPVERLTLAKQDIEGHAGWYEPRARKGGPSTADTVEKCPQEREFWGLAVQHGWPNPNAPGARECYVCVFSQELKRSVADFEDLSPRNWGEMAKIVDMVGEDRARWPKPVKAWMQDRLEAKAAAADSPAEIEHSDNALEDSPFGKDTVGPGAGDPAHVNVAPGRMAQLQGVEFTTGELRGLMAICASKSLKHIELIPIAIAAGHRTAERIIEFADNYQVPKDDRYDALDEPAGVRE